MQLLTSVNISSQDRPPNVLGYNNQITAQIVTYLILQFRCSGLQLAKHFVPVVGEDFSLGISCAKLVSDPSLHIGDVFVEISDLDFGIFILVVINEENSEHGKCSWLKHRQQRINAHGHRSPHSVPVELTIIVWLCTPLLGSLSPNLGNDQAHIPTFQLDQGLAFDFHIFFVNSN